MRCASRRVLCPRAAAGRGPARAPAWGAVAWLALLAAAPIAQAASCDTLPAPFANACTRLVDTYDYGRSGVLIPGYSYHLPFTWSPARRAQLNKDAWGLGLIRTTEDPDGDTHSVYALVFRDSHKHAQWNLGYEYATYWGPRNGVQPGLGYTAVIVQRPDIFGGTPFPALLPIASLRYRDATLSATWIPTLNGGLNHGSTVFVFGRVILK
ncbi:MAG: lipid IV(A) palmitoyltransferase PagP [Casimicrobiaceae bacterium]